MNETRLVKTYVAHNQHRFYRMFIRRGLFGEFALTREWGRIGHPGTVRDDWYPSFEAAVRRLEQRAEDKLRRGYSEGPAPEKGKGERRGREGKPNGKGAYPKGPGKGRNVAPRIATPLNEVSRANDHPDLARSYCRKWCTGGIEEGGVSGWNGSATNQPARGDTPPWLTIRQTCRTDQRTR